MCLELFSGLLSEVVNSYKMTRSASKNIIQETKHDESLKDYIANLVKESTKALHQKILSLEQQVSDLVSTNKELIGLLTKNRHIDSLIVNDSNNTVKSSALSQEVVAVGVQRNTRNSTKKCQPLDSGKTDGSVASGVSMKRNKNFIRGSAAVSDGSSLAAPAKKLWLYVGRCRAETTVDSVISYLQNKMQDQEFEVVKLVSKGSNAAFRVSTVFSEQVREELYSPGFWPENIIIKHFKFFHGRKQSSGSFA